MEKVNASPCVIARLLEGKVEQTAADALFWVKAGMGLELQAVGELVFDLELGAENVGGSPGVGEDSSILWVGIFGLEVTSDQTALRVLGSSDLEGHIGGSLGLDFKTNRLEWEVTTEEVIGAFSKVLCTQKARQDVQHAAFTYMHGTKAGGKMPAARKVKRMSA